MSDRRGFTFIEFLIVVAIISLVAAILLPALANARNKSKDNIAQNINSQVFSELELNMKDLDRFPYLISVSEANDSERTIAFRSRLTLNSTSIIKLRFDEPSYQYIKDHMYIVDVKSIVGIWKSEQANNASEVEAEK